MPCPSASSWQESLHDSPGHPCCRVAAAVASRSRPSRCAWRDRRAPWEVARLVPCRVDTAAVARLAAVVSESNPRFVRQVSVPLGAVVGRESRVGPKASRPGLVGRLNLPAGFVGDGAPGTARARRRTWNRKKSCCQLRDSDDCRFVRFSVGEPFHLVQRGPWQGACGLGPDWWHPSRSSCTKSGWCSLQA
jgi:hypothetical protein